jgi:hypothetical protein
MRRSISVARAPKRPKVNRDYESNALALFQRQGLRTGNSPPCHMRSVVSKIRGNTCKIRHQVQNTTQGWSSVSQLYSLVYGLILEIHGLCEKVWRRVRDSNQEGTLLFVILRLPRILGLVSSLVSNWLVCLTQIECCLARLGGRSSPLIGSETRSRGSMLTPRQCRRDLGFPNRGGRITTHKPTFRYLSVRASDEGQRRRQPACRKASVPATRAPTVLEHPTSRKNCATQHERPPHHEILNELNTLFATTRSSVPKGVGSKTRRQHGRAPQNSEDLLQNRAAERSVCMQQSLRSRSVSLHGRGICWLGGSAWYLHDLFGLLDCAQVFDGGLNN